MFATPTPRRHNTLLMLPKIFTFAVATFRPFWCKKVSAHSITTIVAIKQFYIYILHTYARALLQNNISQLRLYQFIRKNCHTTILCLLITKQSHGYEPPAAHDQCHSCLSRIRHLSHTFSRPTVIVLETRQIYI